MRILLASKREPDRPGRMNGGVQTWVATVAAELRRIGHSVTVVGAGGAPDHAGYDLGIFANAGHTASLARFCGHSLLVVHGIVPDESPEGWDGPVAFTSEEVRGRWQRDGRIIRQPLDLRFWNHGEHPERRNGGPLVRYANRGGLSWLPMLAGKLGMPFVHVRNATPEHARRWLRMAACVLASGRCAVEAAACGAPVVVCDDRPYQGPLLARFGDWQAERNYSGRGGIAPDEANTRKIIGDAMAAGDDLEYVRQHHDVRRIIPQIMEAACCTY